MSVEVVIAIAVYIVVTGFFAWFFTFGWETEAERRVHRIIAEVNAEYEAKKKKERVSSVGK